MLDKRGIELSIRLIVILLISTIVLLAVLVFFGNVWDTSPFEHAMGNLTEQQSDLGSKNLGGFGRMVRLPGFSETLERSMLPLNPGFEHGRLESYQTRPQAHI